MFRRKAALARTLATLLLLQPGLAPATPGLPRADNATTAAAPVPRMVVPTCDPGSVMYEIGAQLTLPPTLQNTVALTFDDGPDELGMTERVLDTLGEHQVPATFFVNTNTHSPLRTSAPAQATLRRIRREGYTLGNHTATHPELAILDVTAVADELDEVENAVRLTLDDETVNLTLMRAPYGRPFNPGYRDGADAAGFCRVAQAVAPRAVHVYWQLDPRDWEVTDPAEVVARVEALVAPRADGSRGGRGVLLLHSDRPQTAAALPEILAVLRRHGIQVVDLESYVAAALGAPSAQLVGR